MIKAKYVDGYVLIVPKEKVPAYIKMAKDGAKAWKKFGALDYKECMADDLSPAMGITNPFTFTKMTKAKPDDTIWFSFVTFKNKKHRDQVNKKVMEYMGKKYADMKKEDMPFEMKKMAYGGFSVVIS